MSFHTEISEFCVCALMSILLSVLVRRPVGFSSDFTSVEDNASQGVLRPLSDGAYNSVWSVR